MKNMRDLLNLFEASTFDRWATDSMRAVYDSIMHRIKMQYMDLVQKHGPEKVLQAVESAAEFYGGRELDEIGSSDVYAYLSSVFSDLGEDLEEWRAKADESISEDQGNPASELLQSIKAEADKKIAAYKERGFRIGDASEVNAFEPNEEYPAPWRAVGRPSEPWSIYADNNKTVATWLIGDDAKFIAGEFSDAPVEEGGSFRDSLRGTGVLPLGEGNDIAMQADRLEEIAQQIMELTDEAIGMTTGRDRARAEAYWYGHILSAAGDDSYAGSSMHTMMDSVAEMREYAEDDYHNESKGLH